MSDRFTLNSRTALVTGSSRGLGFAMAEALAQHGAYVILNGRNAETVEGAVQKLKDADLDAAAPPFDVNDANATVASVKEIGKAHGRLDILVNNAGIQHRQSSW